MKVRSGKDRRRKRRNPLRLDPSRTLDLRQKAMALVGRRFEELGRRIDRLVEHDNAFDLPDAGPTANVRKRFSFRSSKDKLKGFRDWMDQQLGDTVLGKTDEEKWEEYVKQGNARGRARAFDESRGRKRPRWKPGEGAFYAGSKSEFLRSSFNQPEAVHKVKLLASRTYTDLKNVTDDMRTKMGRVLVDGLVTGENPRRVATKLRHELGLAKVRAETIARTEIVRAHAEGQLDSMEALGIEEVGAQVEWLATEDDRLCPLCQDLEGQVFSIADARGLLPRHPNCRCAWAPVFGEDLEDDEPAPTRVGRRVQRKVVKKKRKARARVRRFVERSEEDDGEE